MTREADLPLKTFETTLSTKTLWLKSLLLISTDSSRDDTRAILVKVEKIELQPVVTGLAARQVTEDEETTI